MEKEWVDELFKACAALRNYVHIQVLNTIEKDKRYIDAKANGRIDYMIKLVEQTILQGAVTETVCQGNQRGREYMVEIATKTIGSKSGPVHLAEMENLWQGLKMCGFDAEDRSGMDDPISPWTYMMGQFMISLRL